MAHSYYSFNERQAGSVPLDTIEFSEELAYLVEEELFDSIEALQRRVAELVNTPTTETT